MPASRETDLPDQVLDGLRLFNVSYIYICIYIYIHAGSSIKVGSPGNFEAELRLPRQNWNNLVNLPRQNFVTFSHWNNLSFSGYQDRYRFSEAEFNNPRQWIEAHIRPYNVTWTSDLTFSLRPSKVQNVIQSTSVRRSSERSLSVHLTSTWRPKVRSVNVIRTSPNYVTWTWMWLFVGPSIDVTQLPMASLPRGYMVNITFT